MDINCRFCRPIIVAGVDYIILPNTVAADALVHAHWRAIGPLKENAKVVAAVTRGRQN